MFGAVGEAIQDAAAHLQRTNSAIALAKEKETLLNVLRMAEDEVEKIIRKRIHIQVTDIDDLSEDWKLWIGRTGVNSLCIDATWEFVFPTPSSGRLVDQWHRLDIRRVFVSIERKPDPDEVPFVICKVDWTPGQDSFTIRWYPRALAWLSPHCWWEPGQKYWWVIRDEIVSGLHLGPLVGRCFYKSGWLSGFEDLDPRDTTNSAPRTLKQRRWFQFRHWVLFWFGEAQEGWDFPWSARPPPNNDGSPFALERVVSLPGMTNFSLSRVRLPSLPDVALPQPEEVLASPKAPDARKRSIVDIVATSSLAKHRRPTGKWDLHGYVELEGLKCVAKGKMLVLSNAKVTNVFEDLRGRLDVEPAESRLKLELECDNEEQAASWVASLIASGVEVGETPGSCCVVS